MRKCVFGSRRFPLLVAWCIADLVAERHDVLILSLRLVVFLIIWWCCPFKGKLFLCIIYYPYVHNSIIGNILISRPEFSLIIRSARVVDGIFRYLNNVLLYKTFLDICPFLGKFIDSSRTFYFLICTLILVLDFQWTCDLLFLIKWISANQIYPSL